MPDIKCQTTYWQCFYLLCTCEIALCALCLIRAGDWLHNVCRTALSYHVVVPGWCTCCAVPIAPVSCCDKWYSVLHAHVVRLQCCVVLVAAVTNGAGIALRDDVYGVFRARLPAHHCIPRMSLQCNVAWTPAWAFLAVTTGSHLGPTVIAFFISMLWQKRRVADWLATRIWTHWNLNRTRRKHEKCWQPSVTSILTDQKFTANRQNVKCWRLSH